MCVHQVAISEEHKSIAEEVEAKVELPTLRALVQGLKLQAQRQVLPH